MSGVRIVAVGLAAWALGACGILDDGDPEEVTVELASDSVQEVLVDEVQEDQAIGRSKADAPEIDGIVQIRDGQGLSPGDMVQIKVESADDYDLIGRITD